MEKHWDKFESKIHKLDSTKSNLYISDSRFTNYYLDYKNWIDLSLIFRTAHVNSSTLTVKTSPSFCAKRFVQCHIWSLPSPFFNVGLNLGPLFKIQKKNYLFSLFSVPHKFFWPDLPKSLAKISQRPENRKDWSK